MPRRSALRVSVLRDLAAQLRYAPARRTIEQIERAIEFADELEPEQLYPEEWLVHRITGYRPDVAEPAMVVGEALRRDLSAFTEHISDQAELERDAIEFPSMTLDALQERWSVSDRTIERYRRAGLLALRVRDRGRTRLMFPIRVVESFEASHQDALAAARSRSQLPPEDRRKLVDLAARLQRRFGWSLNETARRLAEREGRSHEGMRQLLLKAGGQRASITPDDRRRRLVMRAWRAGIPLAHVGERLEKSDSTIRRILQQERAAVIRDGLLMLGVDLDFGAAPVNERALESTSATTNLLVGRTPTAGAFIDACAAIGAPNRTEEQELIAAHRALLVRLAGTFSRRGARSTTDLDRAETDARWSQRITARLVRMHWPFMLKSIEARLDRPMLELPAELVRSVHRDAHDAAVATVWQMDMSRGGRLTAAIGLAVDRACLQWRHLHAQDLPDAGNRAMARGTALSDWTKRIAPWQRWLDPPQWLIESHEEAPAGVREIAAARYGLDGGPPRTRQEVASILEISVRRVSMADEQCRRQRAIGGSH